MITPEDAAIINAAKARYSELVNEIRARNGLRPFGGRPPFVPEDPKSLSEAIRHMEAELAPVGPPNESPPREDSE